MRRAICNRYCLKTSPKTLLGLAALAAGLGAPPVEAAVSANTALVSEYVFRGYTQTAENPALQAGAEASAEMGLYLGGWASNVEFVEETGTEVDFIGGWRGKLPGDVGLDLGYIQYTYSEALDIDDIREAYAAFVVGPATIRVWDDLDDGDRYYDLEWKLTGENAWVDVALHAGRYKIDAYFEDCAGGPASDPCVIGDVDPSYSDYRLSLTRSYRDFALGLQLWSTDVDDTPDAEARAVLSLAWTF